jgi:hypothetical protein
MGVIAICALLRKNSRHGFLHFRRKPSITPYSTPTLLLPLLF